MGPIILAVDGLKSQEEVMKKVLDVFFKTGSNPQICLRWSSRFLNPESIG
jgi:hypothetical protein